MSRINRRNWTDNQMGIVSSGGLFDLFDNTLKQLLRVTDDEFDHLIEYMPEGIWDSFLDSKAVISFSDKRKIIEGLNNHINYE